MKVAAPPDFAAWRHKGRRLAAISRASPWAVADWIVAGEHAFSERVDAVLSKLGIEVGEATELARVVSRFPPERRRRVLSFAHHAAVCDLDPADADALLEEAERNRWTRRRLERAVRELRRGVGADP